MQIRRLALWLACGGAAWGADVTFTKDVAPILNKNCVACHRPNDVAPMSLLSYKEARPWAKAMREAVLRRSMPPWHADPHYGQFSNDMRLSDADIATIKSWADAGAPEGDPKDLPPQPKFDDKWKLGTPDVVVSIGQDYPVVANGPDEVVTIVVPTGFLQDRWIKAVELRPGNRRVVHHAHVFLVAPEKPAEESSKPKAAGNRKPSYFIREANLSHIRADAPVVDDACADPSGGNSSDTSTLLGSYLPGKTPDVYADGTAKLLPAGSKLSFQIHYSRPKGEAQTDRTSVGLVFAKEPPAHPLRRVDLHNFLFRIPAGANNHEVKTCHEFDKNLKLLSYVAHMHYRGKDMKFELERTNGTKETLLFVPKYDFNWQTIYRVRDPITVRKGDRMIITAHFDNSANNRLNPDPTKTIRWGDPSYEEMMDGWLEYIDLP